MLNRIFSHTPEKARQTAVGWLARAWLILVLLMQCFFSSVAAAQNLTASAQSTPTSRTGDSVWLSNAYDPLDRRIWNEQFRDQYGPKPNSEWGTGPLFIKTPNSNGQTSFAYYHHDQQQTPVQATDKAGNIVWAASYTAFGKASITTPQATADKPTITSNLRLPGQYEDAETGLHYNYRRYYDAEIGRYISQDPIGLEGGLNLYQYANADPVNQTDTTGECPQCAAFAVCMASCALTTAATNAINGECNNWGNTAKDCAIGCAAGMGLGKLAQWGKKAWDQFRAPAMCTYSFPADTVVHTKPQGASLQDAQQAQATLKAISQLQVGDEVLAIAEWKDKGTKLQQDQRLSYEKVTDIFTSYKEQTLIHLTLANGEQLTATEGHPFKTTEGWRDAVMLKTGGKLLLKGGDADSEPAVEITDIQTERKTLPVFNIEVANAHTYFVGIDGVGVHNARAKECMLGGGWGRAKKWFDTLVDPNTVTTRANGTLTGKTLTGKPVDLHSATSQNRVNVPTVGVHPPGQPPTKYRF